ECRDEACISKDIPMVRIKSSFFRKRNGHREITFHEDILSSFSDLAYNSAVGVYKPGDPCVGGSSNRDSIFHRPKDIHSHELIGSRCLLKPGFVGDIDHESCPVLYKLPEQIGEDALPAYGDTELHVIQIEECKFFSGHHIACRQSVA